MKLVIRTALPGSIDLTLDELNEVNIVPQIENFTDSIFSGKWGPEQLNELPTELKTVKEELENIYNALQFPLEPETIY